MKKLLSILTALVIFCSCIPAVYGAGDLPPENPGVAVGIPEDDDENPEDDEDPDDEDDSGDDDDPEDEDDPDDEDDSDDEDDPDDDDDPDNDHDLTEPEPPEKIYTYVPETAASCETAGLKAHYTDEEGNFYIRQGEEMCRTSRESLVLPAPGHSWSAPSYSWSEDGNSCTAVRICERDESHRQTAGASIRERTIQSPGCATMGCTGYDAIFQESWAENQGITVYNLLPLGHDWLETQYEWSGDGSTCRAIRVCSRDASHVETADAVVTRTVTRQPTRAMKGQTTCTAIFSSGFAETQTKVLTDLDKLPAEDPIPETEPEKPVGPVLDPSGRIQGTDLIAADGTPGLYAHVSMDYLKNFCREAHASGDCRGLTFGCGPVSVTYDLKALDAVISQAKNARTLTVSVQRKNGVDDSLSRRQWNTARDLRNSRIYGVELHALGQGEKWEIHDFKDGTASVTVPYYRSEGFRLTVYRIEKNGELTAVPCRYDGSNMTVTFKTPSHSSYAVTPKEVDFQMVWIAGGVLFILLMIVLILNRKGLFSLPVPR